MQEKALEHASELWEQADTDQNGQLTLAELRNLLRTASKRYSHMAEHSRFLDGCGSDLPLPPPSCCGWAACCTSLASV